MGSSETMIVLATSNPGKLAEFKALVEGLPVQLVSISQVLSGMPQVIEDGWTFADNAFKKARAVADAALMMTLADDSGLAVDALGGLPGVRSARFAGERATDAENNAALLKALEDVGLEARSARFHCALCLIDPWSGAEHTVLRAQGECHGVIARSPRGSGGFGYDPLFIVTGDGRTMAELLDHEKNEISHRARAIQALRPQLMELLEERAATTRRLT